MLTWWTLADEGSAPTSWRSGLQASRGSGREESVEWAASVEAAVVERDWSMAATADSTTSCSEVSGGSSPTEGASRTSRKLLPFEMKRDPSVVLTCSSNSSGCPSSFKRRARDASQAGSSRPEKLLTLRASRMSAKREVSV